MSKKPFLGTGMKFPVQINPATGRIEVASNEQSIKESIYLILMTKRTERLTRPEFGSMLDSYVFMDITLSTLALLRRDLYETIMNQEPRVSDVNIDVQPQLKNGRLLINIQYRIIETNNMDNLVFPFYLDRPLVEGSMEGEEAFADISDDEIVISDDYE